MIDCHVHLLGGLAGIEKLDAIRKRLGVERMNVVLTYPHAPVNENPEGFAAKLAHPDAFYIFAALDHTAHFSQGRLRPPTVAEQVDRLHAIGADGIKLLETKPDGRKAMDIAIDSDHYAGMFARAEELGLPLLWHVADPPEFWDAKLTPRWAAEQGWGYDETFVAYDRLYIEVENVLRRHPKLKVIFPHFFFLSQDLPRAAAFFARYPNVHLDLAPGIEMLYNLSKEPETARESFIEHSSRIIFGTDIWAEQTIEEAAIRSGIVRRWLETGDEFRLPPGSDFLLGPPEDGIIRGMNLPEEALANIYDANFLRIAGAEPRPLDRKLAAEECERIAAERAQLSACSHPRMEALRAAAMLRGLP